MNEGRRLRTSLLAFSLGSAAAAMACGDAKGNADQEAEIEDAGSLAPDDDGGMKAPPLDEEEEEPALEGTLAIVEADSVLSGTETRTPTVGLDVVVNHADGSLAFHSKTGADGRLEVRVPENGSVSLVKAMHTRDEISNKLATWRTVDTWLAPPDGYVIRHEEVKSAPAVADNAPMKVTFPAIDAANTPAGTTKFPMFLSCNSSDQLYLTNTVEFREYKGCPGSDTYDVIVFAQNPAGENLGYAVLLNQPFKPGEEVTHSIKPTETAFVETTTTLTPIPQGATNLSFTLYGASSTRPDSPFTHSYAWSNPAVSTQSAVLRLPAGIANRFDLVESLRVPGSSLSEGFFRQRSGKTPPASSTVSPSSLARVASLEPIDVSVLSQPAFEFSLTSTGSREGCVNTELKWSDTSSPAILTEWSHFQAASTASSARFPELPEEFAAFAPQTGGSMGEATLQNRHIPGKTGLDACEIKDADEVLTWFAYRN